MSADKLTHKKGLNADAVAAQLPLCRGNLAAVARALGVKRQSVHAFVHARPKLLALAADCKESLLDDAEGVLHERALAGEAWALCFFLKTQGKARGYVERTDHLHAGDQAAPIKHKHTHDVAADLAPYADVLRSFLGGDAGGRADEPEPEPRRPEASE